MLKLGVFGAVSKSDTVTIFCWVCGGLCTVAKLTVFAIPPAAKVGVAGADVTVKVCVGLASPAVGASDVTAQWECDTVNDSLYARGRVQAISFFDPIDLWV